MAPPIIYARVEVELSGAGSGWTSLIDDVVGLIEAERGMVTGDVLDRTAAIGSLRFDLRNDAGNSGSKLGYYSPGHANVRSGWAEGIGARLVISIDPSPSDAFISDDFITDDFITAGTPATERVVWTGKIATIDPLPGQYGQRRVSVEALDYIDDLVALRLGDCDVEVGIAEHDAFASVIAGLSAQPAALEITPGEDSYDFFLDDIRDDTRAYAAVSRINTSSFSVTYLKGDGTLVYEPRNDQRAQDGATLTPEVALVESDLRRPFDVITDKAEINSVAFELSFRTPPSVAGGELLYEAATAVRFPDGASTLVVEFFAPGEPDRPAGGIDMIVPESGVDYVFNSQPDGGGTDLTSSVTVTAVFCGTLATLTITNSSGQTAWATTLQLRGSVVVIGSTAVYPARDETAITADGEKAIFARMIYQSESVAAQALADWVLDTEGIEQPWLGPVELLLDPSDPDRAIEILDLEISDLFSIAEPVTALDGTRRWWVNGVTYRADTRRQLVTKEVVPAEAFAGPFIEFPPDLHLWTGGKKSSTDDIDELVSGSMTPEAGKAYFVAVAAKTTSSTNPGTPTVSGLGLTWTLQEDIVYDSSGVDRKRGWLFGAMGTPSAGKITIDNFAGTGQLQGRISASVFQIDTTGADVGAAVVQVAPPATGEDVSSVTATLAAFADAANRPIVVSFLDVDDSLTQEAGWTLIGRRASAEAIMTAWDPATADTTATVTIPGNGGRCGVIAAEIKMD